MELNWSSVEREKELFLKKGYLIPEFDYKKVQEETKKSPFWLHFGTGNIFRAFQANVVQKLLNTGELDRGIIAAGGSNPEIIEKVYQPHDNLSVLVTLKSDGTMEKTVVGSIMESLVTSMAYGQDYARLQEIFANPSLQMVSYTITEKGYNLKSSDGEYLKAVEEDFENGPAQVKSYMGIMAALLYHRYQNGAHPVAMVSMDNCADNGDILKAAILDFVIRWENAGFVEKGFREYIENREKVSFPCSMIDKITPRPHEKVEALLEADRIAGLEKIVTSRGTFAAPFVNAEECEYLVIEDDFPNGRPALEKGGILFTDRETVEKTEKMKVGTCLNPLHTALAVFGCLLGYEKICDEMKCPELKKLVETLGKKEGMPVVVNPKVLNPEEFLNTVLTVRLPNPFMPDTPQRIATDTSQKLSVRFGDTIKAYAADSNLNVQDLKMIPLVFAGWLRYLMGVDDKGNTFNPSPDPLLDTLCPILAQVKLGEEQNIEEVVEPILKMDNIFGVDLYEAGLANQVISYLEEMTKGVGAVESTVKHSVL